MNLFIDTTQKKCNLAIFNNKIIDYISILTNNNLTDLVIEEINKLLKKNKINIKNITSLYLTIGPGSFTGVRIGCIIAKAWFFFNNKIKIFTIDSLLLQLPWKDGISLLDARGEKYYLGIFKNNKKIEEFKIISSEEIKKINKNKICIDYKNINIFNNLLLHIKNFKIIKPSTLLPLYIKPPI